MPDSLQIITTADGSHSLINTALNETYHSVHGALKESRYVFIKNGLEFFETKNQKSEINILEIGFGTGLNALLTLQHSLSKSAKIYYESLEAFPITEEVVSQLNYPTTLENFDAEKYFKLLHQSDWNREVELTEHFTLLKRQSKIQDIDLGTEKFDIIYFDAFAPSKQAEMWELDILKKVEVSMKLGAVFVTYCAKGQLKRDLKSLGLLVETLVGPPGKKEMVRGVKPSPI